MRKQAEIASVFSRAFLLSVCFSSSRVLSGDLFDLKIALCFYWKYHVIAKIEFTSFWLNNLK